jgi:hypothetical protein
MHSYFFVVAAVQSERSESWGVESFAGEFEILDPYLAFWAVRSADLSGNLVPTRKNQHGSLCYSPEVQCAASSFFTL